MNEKIVIVGSGALGTALGKVLFEGGKKKIVIYGVDKKELISLAKGENTKYFPKTIKLPKFKTTENLKAALKDATHVVMAVPSKFMDVVFDQVIENLSSEVLIVNGSKGFYPKSELSLHEGMKRRSKGEANVRGIVSLIGPSHAEEIVKMTPTIVTSVDTSKKLCEEVQALFSNDFFKVYVQTDVKGAEVGASYKNVLAIASGLANGLGYGINTVAALLTRGLAEMQKFNKIMKGKKQTIYGLTGIGDLIVTATSPLSRNYTFGTNLAKAGLKALETKTTVEGLTALQHIYKIAKKKNVELPIVNFLHEVIFDGKAPKKFREDLWMRAPKAE